MSIMKKEYIKPTSKGVVLDCNEQLLESSYVDVGGKTDTFNTHERGGKSVKDDTATGFGNLW